jgi:hypothetical protein
MLAIHERIEICRLTLDDSLLQHSLDASLVYILVHADLLEMLVEYTGAFEPVLKVSPVQIGCAGHRSHSTFSTLRGGLILG